MARKYNRNIVAATLELTSPSLRKARAENRRLRTKLKSSYLIAMGEEAKIDVASKNKSKSFASTIHDILDVIIKFFRQMWRAMTSVTDKLAKLQVTLHNINDIEIERVKIHSLKEFIYFKDDEYLMAYLKTAKEINRILKNIIDQRLRDMRDGNMLTSIRDSSVIDRLNELQDRAKEYFETTDGGTIMVSDSQYPLSKGFDVVTSNAQLKELIRNKADFMTKFTDYAKDVERELDALESTKRRVLSYLSREDFDSNSEFEKASKELNEVLNTFLGSSQHMFGNIMRLIGFDLTGCARVINIIRPK